MRVAVNTASASSPRRRWTGGADDKCRGAPLLTLMHAELPLGGGGDPICRHRYPERLAAAILPSRF